MHQSQKGRAASATWIPARLQPACSLSFLPCSPVLRMCRQLASPEAVQHSLSFHAGCWHQRNIWLLGRGDRQQAGCMCAAV